MRKLIVQQWVTVDNIAAEEDGGLSFASGEPFSETTNPAFEASVMGLVDSVDTLIPGANTYARAKDYRPYADEQGEYGEKRKVRTLEEPDVGDAARVGASPTSALQLPTTGRPVKPRRRLRNVTRPSRRRRG